jgi:hypothetical protein
MGGGVVVVFVKDHINCKHRPDLQIGNLECIWFEIKIKNKKFNWFILKSPVMMMPWVLFNARSIDWSSSSQVCRLLLGGI